MSHHMGKDENALPSLSEICLQPDLVKPITYTNKSNERRVQDGRCTKLTNSPRKTRERTSKILHPLCTSNKSPFPFFRLPQEIRDLVYSCLVVHQSPSSQSLIDAPTILRDRKKRVATQASRDRLNRKRQICGKPPVRARNTILEPILDLSLLQASKRLHQEASDIFYSNNWFAMTLNQLPTTTFETPYGWDLSRIKRLQIEMQLKDATRMNKHIDWTAFFSKFSSLRFLRIVLTFHVRYHAWAHVELQTWDTTHYVHKAFFRELLAAIPNDIVLRLGPPSNAAYDLHSPPAKVIGKELLGDMYSELSTRWKGRSHLAKVEQVVD